MSTKYSCVFVASVALLLASQQLVAAAQLSIGIHHDLTKPTYGLQGQSSSHLTYDDKNGLNLKGTISDILGPPIKIANGFGNMLAGSNMAGVGSSMKTNGAILGVDSKLLEAAGGANLLRGGLLLGAAGAKNGLATAKAGTVGQKIGSVIEVPVKVVAMKDIVTGQALTSLGKAKAAEAVETKTKGANMVKEGDALKAQGMNQVMQGASEGLKNIGNMVQQTTENAATAFRLLPIVLDMPIQQQQVQQTEKTTQQQQQQPSIAKQSNAGALTGGSLFGGLTSLMPGLGASSEHSAGQQFNLFGNTGHQNNAFAALLNAANPFTNLLMNPSLNPLLMPLGGGGLAEGPLAQAAAGKQTGFFNSNPIALYQASLGQSQTPQTHNYNLFPGIKVTETTSKNLPSQQTLSKANSAVKVQQQQVETNKN